VVGRHRDLVGDKSVGRLCGPDVVVHALHTKNAPFSVWPAASPSSSRARGELPP
jgi:hypothetical protein